MPIAYILDQVRAGAEIHGVGLVRQEIFPSTLGVVVGEETPAKRPLLLQSAGAGCVCSIAGTTHLTSGWYSLECPSQVRLLVSEVSRRKANAASTSGAGSAGPRGPDLRQRRPLSPHKNGARGGQSRQAPEPDTSTPEQRELVGSFSRSRELGSGSLATFVGRIMRSW